MKDYIMGGGLDPVAFVSRSQLLKVARYGTRFPGDDRLCFTERQGFTKTPKDKLLFHFFALTTTDYFKLFSYYVSKEKDNIFLFLLFFSLVVKTCLDESSKYTLSTVSDAVLGRTVVWAFAQKL